MAEYIERNSLIIDIQSRKLADIVPNCDEPIISDAVYKQGQAIKKIITEFPTADVVEVVRCKDCQYAQELDKHCEINRTAYKHCSLLRGEETNNVWHKYKKYYKDYSIVSLDDYCSSGERKEAEK